MRQKLFICVGISILLMPLTLFTADCGDVNNSGAINILDITYLISYLYKDGPAPDCGHETGTVQDIDGNTYLTIRIGDQWWMAENLKVTHYRNGDPIPHVANNSEWEGLSTGAYCEYDNNEANVAVYGRLYNWFAVDDSRNIAPEGWHMPTYSEWQMLVDYLGGDAVAGGKLKEAGTAHWSSPNTGATNESGFTALPGGCRNYMGTYYSKLYDAYFWSSTEALSYKAWYRCVMYNYLGVVNDDHYKRNGYSVRCIKD